MAAWFSLHLGPEQVGTVVIRRREILDLSDPDAIADVWSTYDVFRDYRVVGQVRHRYGDWVWRLNALAADLLAEGEQTRRHPMDQHNMTLEH